MLLLWYAVAEEFGGSFVIGKLGSGISGKDSYILAICLLEDLEIDLPMLFSLFSADINFMGFIGFGLSFKSVNLISGKRRCKMSSYNFNRSVSFENSSGFEEAKMDTVDELNRSSDASFELFFTLLADVFLSTVSALFADVVRWVEEDAAVAEAAFDATVLFVD